MDDKKRIVIKIATYLGGPIDAAVDFGARWRQSLKPLLKKIIERLIEVITKEYPNFEIDIEFEIDDPVEKTEETFRKAIDDVHKELAHLQLFERKRHSEIVIGNIVVPDIAMVMKLKGWQTNDIIGFATIYFDEDTRTSGTHIELYVASGRHYEILERISGQKLELTGIHKIAAKPVTIHIISPDGLAGVLSWPDALSSDSDKIGKIFPSFSEYLDYLERWLLSEIRKRIENFMKPQ